MLFDTIAARNNRIKQLRGCELGTRRARDFLILSRSGRVFSVVLAGGTCFFSFSFSLRPSTSIRPCRSGEIENATGKINSPKSLVSDGLNRWLKLFVPLFFSSSFHIFFSFFFVTLPKRCALATAVPLFSFVRIDKLPLVLASHDRLLSLFLFLSFLLALYVKPPHPSHSPLFFFLFLRFFTSLALFLVRVYSCQCYPRIILDSTNL